ncbi:hypothetical protein ABG768_003131 [Culter alburnus]|uniref:Uncharacterized protein n=1 Tax=Culter alburnus TaxID=194366 RepID=A0AAW2A8J1_CULAL
MHLCSGLMERFLSDSSRQPLKCLLRTSPETLHEELTINKHDTRGWMEGFAVVLNCFPVCGSSRWDKRRRGRKSPTVAVSKARRVWFAACDTLRR